MARTYVVYDGRALTGDTEDASVLVACETLKEAKSWIREDFPDGVAYSYERSDDGLLIDERWEWNLSTARRIRHG